MLNTLDYFWPGDPSTWLLLFRPAAGHAWGCSSLSCFCFERSGLFCCFTSAHLFVAKQHLYHDFDHDGHDGQVLEQFLTGGFSTDATDHFSFLTCWHYAQWYELKALKEGEMHAMRNANCCCFFSIKSSHASATMPQPKVVIVIGPGPRHVQLWHVPGSRRPTKHRWISWDQHTRLWIWRKVSQEMPWHKSSLRFTTTARTEFNFW